MTILKRSGKTEKLTSKKIYDSICNANSAVEKEDQLTLKQIKRITESVVAYCEDLEEPIEIDVLEDVIEKKLMEAQGYEVAKRYITYRYEKERIRLNTSLTEKLTASNVQNQNANVDEFSFGGRIGETASFVAKQYALDHLISKKAVRNHVNNEIYKAACADPDLNGMGTTMVAAVAQDGKLYVANVGDSRLYAIGGEIRQITMDHSLVEELIRKGELERKKGRNHPEKNIITKAMGSRDEMMPDFFEIEIQTEEKYLLCSDGLSNMVEDDEIRDIVSEEENLDRITQELVDRANYYGGSDNISVIVISAD